MAVLTPRKVHAVAATLVDVLNTVSVRDVENSPRHAVTLQGSGPACLQPIPITLQTPDGTVFKVPPGKRLIIEHVSGQYNLAVGTSTISTTLTGSAQTPSSGMVPVDHYFLATYQRTLSFFWQVQLRIRPADTRVCRCQFECAVHIYCSRWLGPGHRDGLLTVVDCAGARPVEP